MSDAEARRVFNTNISGALNVLCAALPILRAQKVGHVVNFSSANGVKASQGFGIYNDTKSAIEGLSVAML